ncbi:hypothetical protein EII17_11155 [Clostridiales bacterium COT073_COT-073]|nr:hypothetical protein EII17_11155 [Clostridiales bacterium COT073_COT-073]
MEKYGKSFKELNKKEKLEYIIEYYKFHIIGGLVGLVIVFSLLNHYLFNPPKEVMVDITITAPYLEPQGLEALQTEVREFIEPKLPGKTGQIELLYFSPNNDPQTQMVMTTKLIGKTTTGELDILILDDDHLSYFNENQILLPLAEYLTEEQMTAYAGSVKTINQNGKEIAVAFAVSHDSKIGKLFSKNYEGYFGVAVTSPDIELIKELIPLLLD